MNTIRTLSIFILAVSTSCVTTNINQPPSVIEGTTPGYRRDRATNQDKEDAYFEEASKQDRNFREVAANDCQCNPENSPPGYEPQKETIAENTTQPESQPAQSEIVPVATTTDVTDFTEDGIASWYGRDFDGRPTASGETFDSRRLTAAHKTLPLGTVVLVKNTENNKEVILKVNDRGPFVKGRILDVSEYASEVLAFKEKGLTRVSIRVIKQGDAKDKGEGATAMFFKRPELDSAEGGAELDQKPVDKEHLEQAKRELKTEANFRQYAVQIGLFTDLENATRLKTYLGDRYGQPVNVFQRSNEFVVKVGSFSDRFGAEQLKLKLEADGYSGFISTPSR